MKGDKEFRAMGIKEGGERVAGVTRILTWLKGDSTVVEVGRGFVISKTPIYYLFCMLTSFTSYGGENNYFI